MCFKNLIIESNMAEVVVLKTCEMNTNLVCFFFFFVVVFAMFYMHENTGF